MTDTNDNAHDDFSAAGGGGAPEGAGLPQVESPDLSPFPLEPDPAHAADRADHPGQASGAAPVSGHVARGTALVVTGPRIRAEAPHPKAGPQPAPSPQFSPPPRRRTLVAAIAMTAVLGGLAGSLATAGIARLNPPPPPIPAAPPPAAPTRDMALVGAVDRIDRELGALKAGVDGTAARGQQLGKIAERVDRAEKAQADANAKLAKTSDALDRLERRLAASPSLVAAASLASVGDVTGTTGEAAGGAASHAPPEPKQNLAPPTVEGWVLRDAYRGSALIQGRGGLIEVLPGDVIPGLGRIDAIRRQDGRWVVVTSRGLIVSR